MGAENTEVNRQFFRQTLLGAKEIGDFRGSAVFFTVIVHHDATEDKNMVDLPEENGVIPGIGLGPLSGGKDRENRCRGLDDHEKPTVGHYKAGPRFAKWRATVRVCDLSTIAAAEAAYCFAR